MADTMGVIQNNWKKILLFTILSTLVATITVFLMPRQYRSTAKLIPANPELTDKSRLFNDQIQELYSYFGSGDDLDRMMGVANLDTSYKQLVDEYKLINYYQPGNESLPTLRRKAVLKLKEDISFERTEEGQLKITCWSKDRKLSASIVNTLVDITKKRLEVIWLSNYQLMQDKLNQSIIGAEQEFRQLTDSISRTSSGQGILVQKHMETLLEQLTQYRKTAAVFKLMGETVPASLYVLESAAPAVEAERPDKPVIIIAAAIAGFIFSLLLFLLRNRKQYS
ncbi:MAG: Wzz/FepE/Etk N-terminal domain-containing protein [Bacteroidota bacterium]